MQRTASAIDVERKPHQAVVAEMLFSRLYFNFIECGTFQSLTKRIGKRFEKTFPLSEIAIKHGWNKISFAEQHKRGTIRVAPVPGGGFR